MSYYHLKLVLRDGKVLKVLNQDNLNDLEQNYLEPHFKGDSYFIDGQYCNKELVSKIKITESSDTSRECVNIFKREGEISLEDELECIFNNSDFANDITKSISQTLRDKSSAENEWIYNQLNSWKVQLDRKLTFNVFCIKSILIVILIIYIYAAFKIVSSFGNENEQLISLCFTLISPIALAFFPVITGRNFSYPSEWKSLKRKIELRIHKKNNFDQKTFEMVMKRIRK